MISATWDEVLAKLDLIEAHFKIAERSLVEADERIAALDAEVEQLSRDRYVAQSRVESFEQVAREVLAAIKHFDNPSDGGLSQHHPLVEKLSNLLEPKPKWVCSTRGFGPWCPRCGLSSTQPVPHKCPQCGLSLVTSLREQKQSPVPELADDEYVEATCKRCGHPHGCLP